MVGLFISFAGMSSEVERERNAVDSCLNDLNDALDSALSAFDLFRFLNECAQALEEEREILAATLESDRDNALAGLDRNHSQRIKLRPWRSQVARVYVMDVWATLRWMSKLKNLATFSSAIRSTFDLEFLEHCWAEIETWNYVKSVRDAAAHAAEHRLDRAPKKSTTQQAGLPEHIASYEESKITMSFQLHGDRAIATWDRHVVQFDCTEDRLAALQSLRDRIFYGLNVWPDHIRTNTLGSAAAGSPTIPPKK